MEELKIIIGSNIARLRTEHKLTQLELAEKLNYSDKSISKWERGEAVPDVYVLVRLAELFSVSVDQLLSANGKEKPSDDSTAALRDDPESESKKMNRDTLIALVLTGIWALGVLVFVGVWIAGHFVPSVFVYTLLACAVVALVLNSVWREGKRNSIIVCVLIIGILASVYTAFLRFNYWQVFLLAPPAFLIVYMASKLKK